MSDKDAAVRADWPLVRGGLVHGTADEAKRAVAFCQCGWSAGPSHSRFGSWLVGRRYDRHVNRCNR